MAEAATRAPFVVVLVTVPDRATGEKIARALLDERLAACVNRLGPVRSLFRWQGKIDEGDEHLLLIKTRRDLFERVEQAVARLHPYEVLEVIALPIVAGAASYLHWIDAETER
jgi:periplasmic divalent cation tolerance protein